MLRYLCVGIYGMNIKSFACIFVLLCIGVICVAVGTGSACVVSLLGIKILSQTVVALYYNEAD